MLDNYLTFGDERFEIRYIAGEHLLAEETFAILNDAFPYITGYFRLSEPFPEVRVVLVPDRDEFDRLVQDLLRVDIEVPSNPARTGQTQRTCMVVLSPSAYESHSIYEYIPDDFRRLLIHELIHVVEEYLSPDIEVSPVWWSEGLAVYLSDQWRYEDEFRKTVLESIAANNIPGFRQIETDRKLFYYWGWTIVRFIENTYGREMILRIVRECSDGNVFSVTGEEPCNLENQWRDWLLLLRGTGM